MTEPLSESLQGAERLALLYRVSQAFNSSLDLDEVLNRVMDEVIAATRAERGFLMLPDAGGALGFRAARGMDQRTIEAPEFQISRGLVDRVAREGQPVLTSDAQSDDSLKSRASVMLLGLRSVLCVPLQIKGMVLGVVYVDSRIRAGIFKQADLELLTAIASSAAVAIENARLYQVAVDKGRLERELQLARDMQASLLPRETPTIAGWEFAGHWRPAREVAGDFYDFIPLGGGQWSLVIADVSDKGMAAALFMALSRSIVRASVTNNVWPVDGISHANRLIFADSANGMFVTMFYAQIDSESGEVIYVNGGHNPPLWYRAATGELTGLERTGMALGVFEAAPYKQHSAQLSAGDLILMYTDGVTDAIDAHGDRFGDERLRRFVLDHHDASAADLVTALAQAIHEFTGEAMPFDDVTLVAVRRL
ncbi:MAG: SpoIIE family protein phosphatase [Chloroflexi bacterium]|nr:SpoIIE family protein phosphatase [Chloroflexota bacterium]